jgi:hypothetical protein
VTTAVANQDAIGVSVIGATTLAGSTITGVSAPHDAVPFSVIGNTSLTDSAILNVTGGVTAVGTSVIANNTGEAFSLVRSTIANVTGQGTVVAVSNVANDNKITNSTITANGGPISILGPTEVVYSDIVNNVGTIAPAATATAQPQLPPGAPPGLKLAKINLPDVRATAVVGQLDDVGDVSLFGSVITMPQGAPNCAVTGAITSNGFNFSDDTTCGLTGTGDRQGAGNDPALSPLADNGGPTPTLLPQTGSPLIDAIPIAACQSDGASGITTDQRGLLRPAMAGCDIGSVEVQPPILVTPKFTG